MGPVPLIEATGLTKRFPGVLALNDVDFTLMPGEVHVLLGENGAGKSTLIKILSGVHKKDSGCIKIRGREVQIGDPREAHALGISTIYQEFNLVPHLTVAENIFLGREPSFSAAGIRCVKWRELIREARRQLESLGIDIDPSSLVSELGVAQKQMVEIAKALSMNSSILIMDEPTAVLTSREITDLFRIIGEMRARGVGIIYISHRLEEVREVGDRATVLRDGCKVGSVSVKEVEIDRLIRMMVGRELKDKFPQKRCQVSEELLRVRGLCRPGVLENVDLAVKSGEIVGLFGLVGAGRTELVRAIFGVDKASSGKVWVSGREVHIGSPGEAIKFGMALLPEERKSQGLVLLMSVKENVTLASLDRVSAAGVIDLRREDRLAKDYVDKLSIKTPGLGQRVLNLSGGNQQKVVLAKWLCASSKLFLFDEPTRGIDVGAKVEVYHLMNELASRGAGILMISSELPEILGMSDRILVMRKGTIVGEFDPGKTNQEELLNCALGVAPNPPR